MNLKFKPWILAGIVRHTTWPTQRRATAAERRRRRRGKVQEHSLVSYRSWCRMAQTYHPHTGWLPSYHRGRTWSCCVILGGNQFSEGRWRALPCWPGRTLWWGRWRQRRRVSVALCTSPVVDGRRRSCPL